MNFVRFFGLFVFLFFTVSCKTVTSVSETKLVNLKKIVKNSETTLIDVRIPEEFAENTADNAINIPLAELQNKIDFLKEQKQIVIFCNRGIQAEKAMKILKSKGVTNAYNGKTVQNIKAIQNQKTMNILENIEFGTEKPNILQLKNSDKVKYFAVALGKGAILKKHTTSTPATLVVLKGEINFVFEDRQFVLRPFDTFEIPVNVLHEVHGITEENLFTLTKEL